MAINHRLPLIWEVMSKLFLRIDRKKNSPQKKKVKVFVVNSLENNFNENSRWMKNYLFEINIQISSESLTFLLKPYRKWLSESRTLLLLCDVYLFRFKIIYYSTSCNAFNGCELLFANTVKSKGDNVCTDVSSNKDYIFMHPWTIIFPFNGILWTREI